MDRGIPTEEVLEQMRQADPPVSYLVGTPRGRLHQLEKDFLARSWEQVREEVEGKLLPQEQEIYVLARSRGRVAKERGMRRQRLKKLWKRLGVLQRQKLTRDVLWLKLGAAKQEAGQAYRLAEIRLPGKNEPVFGDKSIQINQAPDPLWHTVRHAGNHHPTVTVPNQDDLL